ncbi:MAG: FAD-dependent oxidoreductase [Hyphomicrobiaceae bacterium]
MRDPRYDILFEPVKIGPVTAKNRFYQVPHCNGMGHRFPNALAAMRGIKAEGGWGVVCTEEVEIHHTSDLSPYLEGRIWDDSDKPALHKMVEAVHAHDALAGIELVHNGHHAPNRHSREIPLAPSDIVTDSGDPVQARAMDKTDIANLRRWHRNAAIRAKEIGFDIVYVYAGHDMTLLQHFMSRRHNHRTDEYGGKLENRVRLFREVLEDTKEAVGDKCGVVVRLAVDELLGEDGLTSQGEGHDIVAMLAEIPDLWDVNISEWSNDSQTARFSEEGFQEDYIRFVKSLTSKPVVGVGRYTSPDAMVRAVKQGVLDMIGAARPSIADPFLPRKIEEGRIDDIRECIGCNICVSGDFTVAPMRCTQNPTMGEEWRRGWHPERIAPAAKNEKALIIGGGPAGLEAARALGQRGIEVAVAERSEQWGGRAARESTLPGLSTWKRVTDWRIGQIHKLANVALHLASEMRADDIFEFGASHVVIAAGSTWRRDGVGRTHHELVEGLESGTDVLTPDDILSGQLPANDGPVVVFDDDPYYMGGVIAEACVKAGCNVTLVTPAADVSNWTHNTLEQFRIQQRLLELGVTIRPHRQLVKQTSGKLEIACVFTGTMETINCRTLIPVTARLPNSSLYDDLKAREEDWESAGIKSVIRIGDCEAPGTIAAAVHAGHRYAREFGETIDPDTAPYRREPTSLS